MTVPPKRRNRSWAPIMAHALVIMAGYRAQQISVTLRQLFYRLVAAGLIENSQSDYNALSRKTGEARRAGRFPDLVDLGRQVILAPAWESPADALASLAEQYRVDRAGNQDYQLWLGAEKKTLVAQLGQWFGDLGVPIIAFGGYSSQTFKDQVTRAIRYDGRPAILIFAGDFDPSGPDILRDFLRRVPDFSDTRRVAITARMVADADALGLVVRAGKASDARAPAFIDANWPLHRAQDWYDGVTPIQVEVEALPPDILRERFQGAIEEYWDPEAYRERLTEEEAKADRLREIAQRESELEGEELPDEDPHGFEPRDL